MRRVFAGLLILMSAVLCLSGCEAQKIDEGQEKQVAEKGEEMMKAWVSEHMPGAGLENCKAVIDYAPGPGKYLTDYASGVVRQNGSETDIAVNTVSGAVYLRHREEELNEAAASFLYETMGITPEKADFSCFVMAPARDGGSKTKTFAEYFNFGIPADAEDLDAFVRDPDSRPRLEVTADLRLPDGTDLFEIDLAEIKNLCEKCGIFFHNLDISAGNQSLSSLWSRDTSTYRRGWIEQEGFRLWGVLRYRSEEEDSRTKEVKVSDQSYDPEKNLIIEMTETGFRYAFPEKGWDHGFQVWADQEAEFRQYDYLYLDDEAGRDEKDIEKRWSVYAKDMTWKDHDDGTSVMVQKNDGIVPRFYGTGEFRRKDPEEPLPAAEPH